MVKACVLDILENNNDCEDVIGRVIGSKNVPRIRKSVDDMWSELGSCARRAYRMRLHTLKRLHSILEPFLKEEFDVKDRARGKTPNGEIPTILRLSAAIRFFAGGSIYDIMLSHGIGKQSVYNSAYGVVDAVNNCPSLDLNADGVKFPSHEEQKIIAAGFREKSGADFDKIILALDGMLVWTIQPTIKDCRRIKMGARVFHCYRKDKYGYLLLAGVDHKCRFRWIDIRHPSSTSDWVGWNSSKVGKELTEDEDSDLVLPFHTLAGDNAFVENMTMATPIPGTKLSTVEDAYNFYLSQIRITVERAFGILVHRWGILRRPLTFSILKVPAFLTCLIRLHNFCIENGESRHTPGQQRKDERNIRRMAARLRTSDKKTRQSAVFLDENGIPSALVGSGHHFRDCGGRRPILDRGKITPMRRMIKKVEDADLRRPTF